MQFNNYNDYERLRTNARNATAERRKERDNVRNAAHREMINDEYLKKAVGTKRSGGGGGPKRGMDELMKVVLDMQRDIKRVTKGNCIRDAEQYAAKLGPYHQAVEGDYNRDGISDIVIFDADGNPVVVNGWTTKASDWVERNQYYSTAKRDKETGKFEETRADWRKRIFEPKYEDPNDPTIITSYNKPDWYTKTINANEKNNMRWKVPQMKDRSAYRVFQEDVLKPIWDVLVKNKKVDSTGYLSACAYVWNIWILPASLFEVFGERGINLHSTMMINGKLDKQSTIIYETLKRNAETKVANGKNARDIYELFRKNANDPFIHGIADTLITGSNMYVTGKREVGYTQDIIDDAVETLNNRFNIGLAGPTDGDSSQHNGTRHSKKTIREFLDSCEMKELMDTAVAMRLPRIHNIKKKATLVNRMTEWLYNQGYDGDLDLNMMYLDLTEPPTEE